MRKKQFLALLTALVMIFGLLPGISFAAEGEGLSVGDKVTFNDVEYIIASENLITNGDFENDFTDWQTGNLAAMSSANFTIEATGGSDGGKFVTSKSHTGAAGAGSVYRRVEVEPSTAYYHTYYTKTNGQTSAQSDYTVSYLVSNAEVGSELAYNATISGQIGGNGAGRGISFTNEWTHISTVLVGNANARYFTFNARWLGENGITTSFDQVALYKVYPAETAAKVLVKLLDSEGKSLAEPIEMYAGVDGDEYTLPESYAPEIITVNGIAYTRGEIATVTLSKDAVTEIIIVYNPDNIVSVKAPEGEFSVIAGDEPMLPKFLTGVMGNGAELPVAATWSTKGDITVPGKVTYTAEISGYDGGAITAEVEIISCDYSTDTFYTAGNSDGAGFVWNNKLGYVYGGGNVIFDLTFTVTEGSNKLFSYGNETTGSFDGTGPIVRYANTGVFEYHNNGWLKSTVHYEVGKTYRLRTLADVTSKTYQMFVTDENGVTAEITNGPASFRNKSLASITQMFHHGAGYTAGEGSDDMISHRVHWSDGWTEITVNHVNADGELILAPVKTKATTGKTFEYTGVQKVIFAENKTYVLPDINSVPTLENAGPENNVLNVEYYEATVVPNVPEVVNTVVGQAPVMPSQINVDLGNGQSMLCGVTWDISSVDVSKAGKYNVSGRITDLDLAVNTEVNVRELIPDDGAELDKVTIATNNGGWNWYVEPSGTHIGRSADGDPLAMRYEGKTTDINGEPITYTSNYGYEFKHDRTYMGWVEDGGDVVISQYDHDTDEYKRVVIHEKLESDDHNNPAVVVMPDGRILAIYSMHTNEAYMYFRISKYPEDISEWNEEQFYHGTGANATYPSVFFIHDDEGVAGNDVIYIGWRGVHWKPTFAKFPLPEENGLFPIKSNGDGIQPVMEQTQFANTTYGYSTYDGGNAPNAKTDGGATDSGRRPYTKYDYDCERNKIYVTFTANHPDNDRRNHIYYLYLNIEDNGLYTSKDRFIQPLPKGNAASYASQGADGTSGQWGVVTVDVIDVFPELLVFDATEQTGGAPFQPNQGAANERRGWTWDIVHNEKGEPCIVYADITATPPGPNGELPTYYKAPSAIGGNIYGMDDSRTHHYYWYARWDSESQQWVKTFLTYAGKWFHQNATQERCYSGGLTFDHNYPGNVIYLAVPTEGEYGNVFEIYRWESDDEGETWTKRQAITENSPTSNARPNAIYNYKMDEGGNNAGPRLLWISGEYRYWMNYEYKTGVKTDFVSPGFITQDDPEMFAAVSLTADGAELEKLPEGTAALHAKFNISNISIGDGNALLALAHYGKSGALKGIVTEEKHIPARSVPQTSVLGADKDKSRANGLSAMGEPEVIVELDYEPEDGFVIGDSVKLFAWNMGIERQLNPIMEIPYEISTSGSRYLFSDYFTYESDDKLVLTNDEATTYNGWVAKAYSGAFNYNDTTNYVALTKAPFGNTGLHIFRHGDGGLMVSHALPDTDGKDFTLEFTMRHIDEWSWNNTDNQGFTLSNGIPAGVNDATNSHSAFQYRYKSEWRDENGRGTSGRVRNSLAFDGGSQTEIFHNVDLARDLSDPDRYERVDYDKGIGYYDKVDQIYIHDYNDALYTGSLFRIKVNVHPEQQIIDMSVNDGYRTAYYSTPYISGYDWAANPIDTITFSIGNEKWGEVYIDDFRMYLSEESSAIRTVYVDPVSAAPLALGREWTILPLADGANVFFNAEGKAMDVGGQSSAVGAAVGVYDYNNGNNQKFYLEATEGGYLIRGKQSSKYLRVEGDDGNLVLAEKENATVFKITDTGNEASSVVLEIIDMIENGTYISTMEAINDILDEEPAIDAELDFIEEV